VDRADGTLGSGLSRTSENTPQAKFVEHPSLLKNSLCARFHPRLDTKYDDFGAFRARFAIATSPMPTFSTGWGLLRSSLQG